MINEIAWIDLETTSKETNEAKIVQIAVFKTDMELNIISEVLECLVNPLIPIPAEATEVNGITDEMVSASYNFQQVGPGLYEFIQGCHFGGYNVIFDISILIEEFKRIGLDFSVDGKWIIDPMKVLQKVEPRDQSTVYKYYTGRELENAHDAKADILATFEIAKAQIAKYESINTVEDLYLVSELNNRCDLAGKIVMKDNIPTYNFGPNFGKPVTENLGFLNWMLGKDFPSETKSWIEKFQKNF